MVPFLPLSSFQWGFSEGSPKLAMSIQQGGGRQRSYGKPSVTTPSPSETLCPDISLWNVIFRWCFQPLIFLFMFLPIFLQILPRECMDITGVLRSSVVCFPCKAVPLPPWISCIPTGGGFLPPPSLGWSLWAVAALSLTPCAAAAVALLCCSKCCLLTLPPLGDH